VAELAATARARVAMNARIEIPPRSSQFPKHCQDYH
jgi:hypothetical protein